MTILLKAPDNIVLKPVITVIGVGGAGGNAVNNMIAENLQGANFVVANTDAQALENSLCTNRIQLGLTVTRGLGAGASPDVGASAADESAKEIIGYLENSNMVFITAGMGGGTGTGASPVVAKLAKELGLLTVGVVTKPFHFEGKHRMAIAERGVAELQKYVDTLIVIPNQNLFRIANDRTTFADAFKMADNVLHAGVRGVTDLMIMPGLINLDFADIRTAMSGMGKAMMGTGEATGEERAVKAAEAAIANPLLDHSSMKGAKAALIHITGGRDMTLIEVDSAAHRIGEEVGDDANIIFGSTFNPELEGIIRVSVIATGIGAEEAISKPEVELNNHHELEEEIEHFAGHVTLDANKEFTKPLNESEHNFESIENNNAVQQTNNLSKSELIALPQNELTTAKKSFLSKMWNSIKMNHDKPSEVVKLADNRNIENANNQMHELPAFLRKQPPK